MNANIIEVRAARKRYGAVRAVDDVDFDVPRGRILGLIGRNGAGKSTLFRLMLGLTAADAGEIRIEGQPVGGRTFREVRRSIGYLPEHAAFYDNLTGLETLEFFAALKGAARAECGRLLDKLGLGGAAGQPVGGYSKGMRQRLALAQALLGRPRLLFLDEPTNGLDPQGVSEFYAILRELREQGGTVLLTSHILAEIEERVDVLAIMQLGRIRAVGTLQGLRETMALPVTFVVTARAGELPRLREALAAHGLQPLDAADATLVASCSRDRKMAVLQALAGLNGAVADVRVREPSLEDVFLEYAE